MAMKHDENGVTKDNTELKNKVKMNIIIKTNSALY